MGKKKIETKEQKKERDTATKIVEPKKLKVKVAPETKSKSDQKSTATATKGKSPEIKKAASMVSNESKTIAKSP